MKIELQRKFYHYQSSCDKRVGFKDKFLLGDGKGTKKAFMYSFIIFNSNNNSFPCPSFK